MYRVLSTIFCVIATLALSSGCNLHAELDRLEGGPAVSDGGVAMDVGDSGLPDVGDVSDTCEPQTDLEFCQTEGADCGDVTAFDNCEMSRTVNCGTCSDGGACGERQANVCGCPCEIDGTCVAEGAINPDNPCETCDSAANTMGWTVQVGAICTNDDLCAGAAQCSDQGVCETTQIVDCSDELGECVDAVCDPTDGMCKGDPLADGTPCSDDGLTCTEDRCQAGTCEHDVVPLACLSDGVCLTEGESPPDNSCVTCAVDSGSALLKNSPAGDPCGPTLTCAAFACTDAGQCEATVDPGTCAIDGACYVRGDLNPTNRCESCDPTNSQTEWTQAPVGAECRSPNCRCGVSPITNEYACLRPNDADCS